jgi:4-hydroxybenzoyl-CoA reductase subunit alpha
MRGLAARQAAERVRDRIAEAAAAQLGVPAGRLVFAERRVFDAEEPARGLAWEEAVIAAEARSGTIATAGSYTPPRSPGKYRGAGVGPSPTYSYSAAVVEVEVDERTGLWRPLQVWIAHDIGKALNPALVLGQVEGSVYMGLGEAMMEESAFRRLPRSRSAALVHKFPSLLEYKSPTFEEMPPVTTYLIEEPDPAGPFGAKEVGQGPLLPIPPACANAIHDAVGVRVDQVPIHPHMILKALEAKARGKEARFGPTKFPEVDFGFTLRVPTPWEGGDGKATNEAEFKLATGRQSRAGTMSEREEALRQGSVAALTTRLAGKKGEPPAEPEGD